MEDEQTGKRGSDSIVQVASAPVHGSLPTGLPVPVVQWIVVQSRYWYPHVQQLLLQQQRSQGVHVVLLVHDVCILLEYDGKY